MHTSSGLPISNNKVRVPFRWRELISRTRLIDILYEQFEKRILLLVTPAGYGKTSLLVELAQQTELSVCWLSLGPLDQEPQRFLRYLIATITERFPEFGRDSLAALESIALFDRDEEWLLVPISNEINAIIHEHFLPNDRERCLAAGMDEYISKSINLKALLRIIEALLSSKWKW